MNEMIERMAKAMFESENKIPWRSLHCETRQWLDRARISFNVIREPTAAMLDVGLYWTTDSEECWRAMIDAAMQE